MRYNPQPPGYPCACGMPQNCTCGGMPPSMPSASRVPDLSPYSPAGAFPQQQQQMPFTPYAYNHQMPSTSNYGGVMPPAPMMMNPQGPSPTCGPPDPGPPGPYMPQRCPPIPQPQVPYPPPPPQQQRPPGPGPAMNNVAQWMNNHHMMDNYSPVPSAPPSHMGMSHMSLNEDARSSMSCHSLPSMMSVDSQALPLRPPSQISTSSYVENIDPNLHTPPIWDQDNLPFMINHFHFPNSRRYVLEHLRRVTQDLAHEKRTEVDLRILVLISEAFVLWPRKEPSPADVADLEELAKAAYFIVRYSPQHCYHRIGEICLHRNMLERHENANLLDKLAELLMSPKSPAALMTFLHMAQHPQWYGAEVLKYLRKNSILDQLLRRLAKPVTDGNRIQKDNCVRYLFRLLCVLAKDQDNIVAFLMKPVESSEHRREGIIPRLMKQGFQQCDQMYMITEENRKNWRLSVANLLDLLKILCHQKNESVALPQLISNEGFQRLANTALLASTSLPPSSNRNSLLSDTLHLLARLTNPNWNETTAKVDLTPVTDHILHSLLVTLSILVNPSRNGYAQFPSELEKITMIAMHIVAQFITNRPDRKLCLVKMNGFAAIVEVMHYFSHGYPVARENRRRLSNIYELQENCCLALTYLLFDKQIRMPDGSVVPTRTWFTDEMLMKLCSAVFSNIQFGSMDVHRRILTALIRLSDFEVLNLQDLIKQLDEETAARFLNRIFKNVVNVRDNLRKIENMTTALENQLNSVCITTLRAISRFLQLENLFVSNRIALMLRENFTVLIDLLKFYQVKAPDTAGLILTLLAKTADSEMNSSDKFWMVERNYIDSLANNENANISQPSRTLLRLGLIGESDPMANIFSNSMDFY